MPTIKRFEEIEAWKTARDLTRTIYQLTDLPGFSRDFGLRDQIRRAAVSVMSNIAEGFESQTQPQFVRHLGISKGSAGEVRSQLYVALDLGYLTLEQFSRSLDLSEKASRQIARFMSYLETHPNSRRVREEASEYGAT